MRILRDDKPADGNGNGAAASTLNADQAKIQAAVNRVAASQPPEGVKTTAQPRVVKNVLTQPSAKVLEGDFSIGDDAPSDLTSGDVGETRITSQPKTNITDDQRAAEIKKAQDKIKADEEAKLKAAEEAKRTKQAEEAAKSGDKTKEKKEDKTPEQIKVTADTAKATQRDYTGYSEDEQKILKQMSNPAFEFTAAKLKELQTLRNQKPESYLQHPQAYTLTPEWVENVSNFQASNFEATHWKQQLINIRAGKSWQSLQGYDKDGNSVLSGPFKATDEAEIDVGNALNMAMNIATTTRNKLGELQQGFKTRVEADINNLNAERAKRFEWVAKPELQDTHKIEIPGVGQISIKDLRNDFISMLPAYHRGSPLLDLCADMWVAIQSYGQKIRELSAKVQDETKLREDAAHIEPNLESKGGDGGGGRSEAEFSMEGLPV